MEPLHRRPTHIKFFSPHSLSRALHPLFVSCLWVPQHMYYDSLISYYSSFGLFLSYMDARGESQKKTDSVFVSLSHCVHFYFSIALLVHSQGPANQFVLCIVCTQWVPPHMYLVLYINLSFGSFLSHPQLEHVAGPRGTIPLFVIFL